MMNCLPDSFEVIASHRIVGFPDGNIISWCPQMDLLAVSMNHTSIWVFRLDGERIYSINNRAKILQLRWSHSGKFFVLSGADHAIKVYDSNNGKLVNQFATSAEKEISLISWASIDVQKSVGPNDDTAYQDLFRTEILKSMPKLANEVDTSTKDASGPTEQDPSAPFTSALVTNTNGSDESVDYLLVANGDRNVSVTFNNLFTVTGIAVPSESFKLLEHAVGNDFFRQSFLTRDSKCQLHLQELHIDIAEPRNRSHFFDSIKYASQMISVVNHINDQLRLIETEAKDFITVYDRYLSNYKDALYAEVDVLTLPPLNDEVEDKIVLDLGEMILTGLIPVYTKDFWLNQFGDRGLTRLSAMGNAIYDNMRKVAFTQIILGLEKLIILLSYLEGISKTAGLLRDDNYGILLTHVQRGITLAQNLVKKVYEVIWTLNDEHEYFNQFLNWVKVEVIEKLSKEDNDPDSFFAENPSMEFKSLLIMEYVSDFMFDSVLAREFDLDCANIEIVAGKHDSKNSLKKHSVDLLDQIKLMLTEMELFFAKKVVFQPIIPLKTLADGIQSSLEIFGSKKMITSVNGNILHVTNYTNIAAVTDMTFPGKIIWHKLLPDERLLVLFQANETKRKIELIACGFEERTMMYDELRVIKSLQFLSDMSVKLPLYVALNSMENSRNIMALILDESKKDYIIIRV